MKSSEEMTQDVLRRMDEYQAEKKTRHDRRVRVATATAPAFIAAAVLIMVWAGIVVTRRGRTATVDIASQSETPSSSPTATPGTGATGSSADTDTDGEATNGGTTDSTISGNWQWISILPFTLAWNGRSYDYDAMPNISTYVYTKDTCIGTVKDLATEYEDGDNGIAPEDRVYTVTDTEDVLLVVRGDKERIDNWGETAVLVDSNWSQEKYFIAPSAPDADATYFPPNPTDASTSTSDILVWN